MKNIFVLLILSISLNCHAQKSDKFNLGFENKEVGEILSTGWFQWGEYYLSTDSSNYTGEKAGKIASGDRSNSFGGIVYKIPAHYSGKSITLEGLIKVNQVQNGYAGLLMRIDGNGSVLAFENMEKQKVTGTKDWEKYRITVNYPEQAEQIFVAGMLIGTGEAWFDDFVVTIDGEDIQAIALPNAISDNEFDHGSTIELGELSAENIADMELLGRVWGFLKYHHPEIAAGNYNWDYELFRFLPKYMQALTRSDRSTLLVDWIGSLGQLEKCESCEISAENVYVSTDLTWIEKQSEDLRNALLTVYDSRAQGENFYVRINPNNGSPVFTNENGHSQMAYPDDGFRLLALFRYWNMVNYFFPSKYLMDYDWGLALKKFIPVIVDAKNELEYELAFLEIVEHIQDSHAYLGGAADQIRAWKGLYFPSVKVNFVEGKLIVTGYHNPSLIGKEGLKVGDIITEINGESIEEIIEKKSKYFPGSNHPTKLRNISSDILRSNSRELSIKYISKDSIEQTKIIDLHPIDSLEVSQRKIERSYKMINDSIGYITLETIKDEDIAPIKSQFTNNKGIIIDLRNYPALNVAYKLGEYFVSSQTPFAKFSVGMVGNPGTFYLSNSMVLKNNGEFYKGKLVVLVNEVTQSLGEFIAMSLRAGNNTTVMGSTTAGADGDVSTVILPGGLQTAMSGVGVYYPDGSETQRVGIVPDILVTPTIEGIRGGRDELLEKAIRVILND